MPRPGIFQAAEAVGDGARQVDEVGVYRAGTAQGAPNTALFSLDIDGNRAFDAADQVFLYGTTTDQFLGGNWHVTPPTQPSAAVRTGDGLGSLTDIGLS